MNFDSPAAFLILPILLPLIIVLRRSERRTRDIAALYKSEPRPRIFFLTRTASICVFIIAMTTVGARPYIAYDMGGSFLFLTDVSRSMQARHSCAEPTFLGRAKKVMHETLDAVPEARAGIVAFDRFAFPITSLSDDHGYLGEVIDKGLYIGLTYEATQTDLGNALSVIAQKKQRLPEIFGQVGHVILLSDGHIDGDYQRQLQRPIQALRTANIGVFAVGIGNPDETPVTGTEAGQCSDQHIEIDGQKVMIPLRADILKFVSSETRGQYFSEAESDELIQLVRAQLRQRVDSNSQADVGHRRDISWIFLGVGTLGLFAYLYVPTGRGPRA
jgi:hypothetical protein